MPVQRAMTRDPELYRKTVWIDFCLLAMPWQQRRNRELLGDDLTPEAVARLRQDEERLEAAVVPIKDGLLDEAERVLAKKD